MSKLKVAVAISGGGSNLQALIDACSHPDFPAEIVSVLSNRPNAYGLERAKQAGIETVVIDHRGYSDRESFDVDLDKALQATGADLICLAGFMRILTDDFVRGWEGRMINIHPSLLPKYRGLHTHKRAIEAGDAFHGCTVHYVSPELDAGPLIIQAKVPIEPGDTADSLAARVLTREHVIYPQALQWIAEGRVTLDGEIAVIDGKPGPVTLDWAA